MATRSQVLAWLMDFTFATDQEFIKRFGDEAKQLVSDLRELGLIKYAIRKEVSVLILEGTARTKHREGYDSVMGRWKDRPSVKKLAKELGIRERAVRRIGMDHLDLMSDDARQVLVNDRARLAAKRKVAA